jgi:hypothetical protein
VATAVLVHKCELGVMMAVVVRPRCADHGVESVSAGGLAIQKDTWIYHNFY